MTQTRTTVLSGLIALSFAALPVVAQEAAKPPQDPEQQPSNAVVTALAGGAVTTARTIFTADKGEIRDHVLLATKSGLHAYVLVAVDAKTVELHWLHSEDKAVTWSKPERLLCPVDVRAKWVKAWSQPGPSETERGDCVTLLIGSDPSLGPQTPRITHFLGKRVQGFLGMLWVVRLQEDAKTVQDHSALRLENPGNMIYSQFPFRPSFELTSHGEGRVSLVGTSVFRVKRGGGTSQVWSLISAHSKDDGKTWSKVSFRQKAYPGLRMLRPGMVTGKDAVHAVFGDRFDKKLVQWRAMADGSWQEATSDLGKISQWNYWYDALDEGDVVVVTDTVETKPAQQEKGQEVKPRFGIVEFASKDHGATWTKRRTIDMDLAQAYAAFSHRAGKTRAHVAWDVAAISVDDGKTWMKTSVAGAFRSGHSMLVPSRGLALSASSTEGAKSVLKLVIFSP